MKAKDESLDLPPYVYTEEEQLMISSSSPNKISLPSSFERRQLRTKDAKVCEKEKEEGEGIDDLLTHAVMPPLYKQYWEYLHESF